MSSVYQIVQEKIIKMLSEGRIPWKQPWVGLRPAFSVATGRIYSWVNQCLLSETGPGAYATYDYWHKMGCTVKKGAKAGTAVFWKMIRKEDEGGHISQYPTLRYYHLFHESQVDGYESEKKEDVGFPIEPIAVADKLLTDYVTREGITVEEVSSNRAYYDPVSDIIHLPLKNQFRSTELYYSVYAHEAIHSTGLSPNRLSRKGLQDIQFGSEIYGTEELIAEMGSSYILSSLGIDNTETLSNSVAYIQSWMSAIKKNEHMFVSAASAAERAVSYIYGRDT